MNKRFVSIILVFVICGSLAVFQATRSKTSLVLLPSEVMSKKEAELKRIRVAGKVSEAPIDYRVEPEILLQFAVQDPGSTAAQPVLLPVVYQGIKPDMFATGRDVIIDGEVRDGKLMASSLLTQCPSKYEAPDPGAGGASKY